MSRTIVTAFRTSLAALMLAGSAAVAAPASADGGFLSLTGGSVAEGDSGQTTLNFTLQLTSAQSTPVTAHFVATANHTSTQTGDAIAGSACGGAVDFIAVEGDVTIPANATQTTIGVPVCGDTAIEGNESFTGVVNNVVGSACFELCAAHATILDDDQSQPLPIVLPPTLSISNASVAEGDPTLLNLNAHHLVFTVSLSAASQGVVSVNYQTATKGVSNDATPGVRNNCLLGADYLATSGTLSFAAGETHKTISVTVCGDNVVEANEILLMKLSNPINASIADSLGIGTIVNDD